MNLIIKLENMNTVFKKIFNLIVLHSIPITGCIWNIYHISDVYFSYATNVIIMMKTPTFMEMPEISICHLTFMSVTKHCHQNTTSYIQKMIDKYNATNINFN